MRTFATGRVGSCGAASTYSRASRRRSTCAGYTVSAQGLGTIAGVVRDSSGAVLPGVTVEVASPALIEKVRSVVTDGSGQYSVVSLPVGTYAVTFTLPGFSASKREGVELPANFTAPVNGELSVGRPFRNDHRRGGVAADRRPERGADARRHPDLIKSVPIGGTMYQLAAMMPGVSIVRRRRRGRRRRRLGLAGAGTVERARERDRRRGAAPGRPADRQHDGRRAGRTSRSPRCSTSRWTCSSRGRAAIRRRLASPATPFRGRAATRFAGSFLDQRSEQRACRATT